MRDKSVAFVAALACTCIAAARAQITVTGEVGVREGRRLTQGQGSQDQGANIPLNPDTPWKYAYDRNGKQYTDDILREAIAATSQAHDLTESRPWTGKLASVCHFPPQERSDYQVVFLRVDPLVATALVEKGDFLAPQFPTKEYGYGCIQYDYVCDTSTEESCSDNGVCLSNNNTCFCDDGFATCVSPSNGCETDIATDPNNCGTCGLKCAAGFTCCAGVCANLLNDPNNCGQCNSICRNIANVQTAQCVNGMCQVTCLQPQLTQCAVNVSGTGVTGAFCVNLNTNPNYCGNCTTRCIKDVNNHGTRTCTNGVCGITCLPAYPTQCGFPALGLSKCVNLNSDATNCGGCNIICPTDANANTVCASGKCLFSCSTGYTECNSNTLAPFCANTNTDSNNCGSCGFVCNQGLSCVSGLCVSATTNTGTGR